MGKLQKERQDLFLKPLPKSKMQGVNLKPPDPGTRGIVAAVESVTHDKIKCLGLDNFTHQWKCIGDYGEYLYNPTFGTVTGISDAAKKKVERSREEIRMLERYEEAYKVLPREAFIEPTSAFVSRINIEVEGWLRGALSGV